MQRDTSSTKFSGSVASSAKFSSTPASDKVSGFYSSSIASSDNASDAISNISDNSFNSGSISGKDPVAVKLAYDIQHASAIRKSLYPIIHHSYFSNGILFIILVNTITLALQTLDGISHNYVHFLFTDFFTKKQFILFYFVLFEFSRMVFIDNR